MHIPAGNGKSVVHLSEEFFIIAILAGLSVISLGNYLVFHSIVEIISIAVAFAIFLIIWNTRRNLPDAFYLIIGISLFFVGIIDLVHMLAFRGMGVFAGDTTNLATQLWIAMHYFQSIAFLVATFYIGKSITRDRKHDATVIIAACTTGTVLIFASIFLWQNFPVCHSEDGGLTPFKIVSEYVISLILIVTILLLYQKRNYFAPSVWHFLVGAQVFLILGELALASYSEVYGFMNMLGHLFWLLSVYYFCRAFVVIGLTAPYDLLLRELKKGEHELNERVKELRCMFNISALIEVPGISLPKIFEKSVQLLPEAMQHPDIARARIEVDGKIYQTEGFRPTPSMLAREVLVNDTQAGMVEVCYLEERPADSEGPFLKEELFLVSAVAERLGMVIERHRADKALVASERRYRSFVQSFRGIAYLATADWIPIFFHGSVEGITGYTEAEFIAGNPRWDQVIHPDDLARIQERDNPRLLHEPGFSTLREYRIRRKDGNTRWLSDFIQNWTDESGHLFLSGVLTDITDKKNIEDALYESNQKIARILNSIQDDFYVLDRDWKFVYASRTFTSKIGREPEDFIGKNIWEMFPKHLGTVYEENLRAAMERRELREFELHGEYTDAWYRMKVFPSAEGITLLGTDITERKQADEALRESEEKYRNIIENIEDGYIRINRENRIEMASPSAARMLGYSSMAEMLGMPVEMLWKDLQMRIQLFEIMGRQGGSAQDWETEFRKKDGTALWVSISAHLRVNERGEYLGTEGIVRDISGRKRMEESLRMANRKLNLLSGITRHDIKNQLLALSGYISLSTESVEKPEELRKIFAKEGQIAATIDRQISFTRDYEDLGVKSPIWQDVWAVAHSAAVSLPLQNIRYLLDLPAVEIFADQLLEKVFYNLVDNSLRYGGPAMTSIRISAQDEDDQLHIIYTDDGVGISAPDKTRLFTRGFGKHTGLGLFLSREILGITGIAITEDGEPGKGVRFVITVPKGAFRQAGAK